MSGRQGPGRLTWAGALTVSAGLIAVGLAPAQAAPQKVLQSVSVSVDGRGAITAISSDTVSQEGDEDPKETEREHDPSKVGSKLPLRVLTSYRLGDKVGTDLSDLDGATGRAEISVTVQNTTVRPQVLSYDANGVGKEAPALVGTPLTVMASIRLDGVDTSSVVPAADEGGAGTNGVVSRDADGDAQVQWASILAPPRLGTSATFRLVLDGADLKAPTFDISAQPGLVTDASVTRLVDSVFSSSAGSQRDLETRTIRVLTGVGQSLLQAGDVLAKVEQLLSGSAQELGSKTLADLDRSAGRVDSALGGLSSDIQSLESQMTSALATSRDEAVAQMRTSLDQVKSRVLGDPEELDKEPLPVPTPGQGASCSLTPPAIGGSETVYGQLREVRAQLNQLKTETGACRDAVIENLRATLGSTTDTCPAPPATPTTALGALRCATGQLSTSITGVAGARTTVTDKIDALSISDLGDQMTTVLAGLESVRGLVKDVKNGANGSNLGQLVSTLNGLVSALSSSGTLSSSLSTIHSTATGQVALLGDGDESVAKQAEALFTTLCTLPDSPERTEAAGLLKGEDCAGEDASAGTFPKPLVDRIAETRASWQSVADLSAPDGAQAVVASLSTAVGDALAAATGGNGSVDDKIGEALGSLDDLFSDQPVQCTAEDLPPANALSCAVQTLVANRDAISADVAGAFADVDAALTQANAGVQSSSTSVADGAAGAAEGATSLFGGFGTTLEGIGKKITDQGKEQIELQRDRLDEQVDDFRGTLAGTIAKATRSIETKVAESNRDIATSEKRLAADFAAVVASIGSPDRAGSGLLGSINVGARNTGASNEKIASAGGAVDAFGGVRATSLGALLLQQEQVAASLEAEARFPAFDLTLPTGSTHTTVFSFHVGKD